MYNNIDFLYKQNGGGSRVRALSLSHTHTKPRAEYRCLYVCNDNNNWSTTHSARREYRQAVGSKSKWPDKHMLNKLTAINVTATVYEKILLSFSDRCKTNNSANVKTGDTST